MRKTGNYVLELNEGGRKYWYSGYETGETNIFSKNPKSAFVFQTLEMATRILEQFDSSLPVTIVILHTQEDMKQFGIEEDTDASDWS